jgi:transposase-like protein
MGATWSSESAGNESCPKCNSVYKVTIHRFPMRDSDYFNCAVCDYEMNRWNDTESPSYELIERGSIPKLSNES